VPVPKADRPTGRVLLRNVVELRLRDAIVAGELQPDEDLVESEVERWAGASRTPVREALDRLAAFGLVVIEPQRGTRVAPLDVSRSRQAFSVLGELVTDLFGPVVPHLTSTQRAAVITCAQRIQTPTDVLTRGGLFDSIIAVIGNPRLRQVHDELAPYVLRTWNVSPSTAPPLKDLNVRAWIDAVTASDALAAESVLRTWLTSVDSHADQQNSGSA